MKWIAIAVLIILPSTITAQTTQPIVWGNVGFGSIVGIDGEDDSKQTSFGLSIELPLTGSIRFNLEGGYSTLDATAYDRTETHYTSIGWWGASEYENVFVPGFNESTSGGYVQGAFTFTSSSKAVFCVEATVGGTLRFAEMDKFQLADGALVATAGARIEIPNSPVCVRGGYGFNQGQLGVYLAVGFKI